MHGACEIDFHEYEPPLLGMWMGQLGRSQPADFRSLGRVKLGSKQEGEREREGKVRGVFHGFIYFLLL